MEGIYPVQTYLHRIGKGCQHCEESLWAGHIVMQCTQLVCICINTLHTRGFKLIIMLPTKKRYMHNRFNRTPWRVLANINHVLLRDSSYETHSQKRMCFKRKRSASQMKRPQRIALKSLSSICTAHLNQHNWQANNSQANIIMLVYWKLSIKQILDWLLLQTIILDIMKSIPVSCIIIG
jgi:hypothetical protein